MNEGSPAKGTVSEPREEAGARPRAAQGLRALAAGGSDPRDRAELATARERLQPSGASRGPGVGTPLGCERVGGETVAGGGDGEARSEEAARPPRGPQAPPRRSRPPEPAGPR